jgi:hypothetical protein
MYGMTLLMREAEGQYSLLLLIGCLVLSLEDCSSGIVGFRMADSIHARRRTITLLSSRSHTTVLATAVQTSQSLRSRATTPNACCKNGT